MTTPCWPAWPRRTRTPRSSDRAFTAEPYGLGVNKDDVDFVRFVNGVLEQMRSDGRLGGQLRPWLAARWARHPRRPTAVYGRTPWPPPRRAPPPRALRAASARRWRRGGLHYLDALGTWRDQRRAELDLLDEAALAARTGAFTGDILLSMALWKAVADRHDLLVATWDSGRVGARELERLSTLVWGRLDASLDPRRRPASARRPGAGGALAVSLPEACRLSDALAASLRVRLGVDPSDADVTARCVRPARPVERIRDLVDREPAGEPRDRAAAARRLDGRVADLKARASAAPTSAACSARWRATPPGPSAT